MKSLSMVAAAFAACGLVAGCDKGGGGGAPLDATEKAMLQHLPSGETALLGGNYLKLQNFMQTGLGKLSSALLEKYPGMAAWGECFASNDKLKIIAGVNMTGKDAEIRLVHSGVTLDDIATCAQKASFKTTVDPDHKFMTVEMPAPAGTYGYLVLPDNTLYSRQGFAMGIAPKISGASRAELEADMTALGKTTAIDDTALMPLVGKVDHGKTVWFVGHGDGTAAANKLGDAWGTFDFGGGLALDLTLQLKDSADADKLEKGFGQAQEHADELPGDLKDVVKGIALKRSGGELHMTAKITDAQLKSIVGQFGGMLGAMAPGH
jgi:hypothetical protein